MSDSGLKELSVEALRSKVSMLSHEIEATGMILEQIVKLTTADNLDEGIEDMLASVGSYLKAERIYIFQEQGKLFPNTHEWCAEGIHSMKDSLQNFSKEKIVLWLHRLDKGECILIPDVEELRETMPDIYALLKKQKIGNIVLAPVMMENRFVGFIGVDNAPQEITKLIAESLTSLGACLGTMMQVCREQEKIRRQNLELLLERKRYRNALSNRCEYCYAFDVTEGVLHERFVTAHGVDIEKTLEMSFPAGFDEINEKYLSCYRAEFLDEDMRSNFCCKGLLEQFEKGVTNAESEYYSPVSDTYLRVSFLLSKDEENGHIHAVVIAIDTTEARKKEARQLHELTRTKEDLSDVNEELRASLTSEQEKISVIGAMSNIYYASYLINLKNGIMNVMSTRNYLEDYFVDGGLVKAAFEKWIDNVLDEKFAEEVRTFTDLETLPSRLKDTQIVSCECISKIVGWIRISFIVVNRDEQGDVQQALWVGQHIDKEKQMELKQREALKAAYEATNRANAAKTSFLASMSHDIRTPMNAIIGMTAIAGTHLDDKERVADCLGKIAVSSKHLLGLINEVLDMSKIEAGKLDLHDEEFSLPELIDSLLDMVKVQIKNKEQELTISVNKIEHERVIGDEQRLLQAFMNLMSNAIKYTPTGGKISLSISEKPMNKPKAGCFEFVFQDNGIGMSEEFISRMFEPFTRAADSRVEKIQGTGLGMSITKTMVEMMNGNIKVSSRLNEGTRITVTIVMKLAETTGQVIYEDFLDLPILVADDDEIACQFTCEILEELGMKGECVYSGQEAVDVVVARHKDKRDFFAVIIDWKMPGMDGIKTTKEIRRQVGDEVPIIIISAYDWSDIELEARAAGANAFISKPLFKSRVEHLFNDLLGRGQEAVKAASLDTIIKDDFTGKRVLLVEDNDLNSEIAGEILAMAGLSVDYARDGKEAVDIMTSISDDYYDIVFMDIQMPVMNGYDAATAIRALPGNYTKRVPIIAMTANAFSEDIQAAKNAGMNQHLAKPLDFRQLVEILHKWLD